MVRHDAPTLRQVQVPVALVIGGDEKLKIMVEEAALRAQVLVAECTVAEATNAAAEMRPLVMVLSEDVYGFDPDSFEALARDVSSQVLVVPADGIPLERIEAQLKALMLEAEEGRPSWTGDTH